MSREDYRRVMTRAAEKIREYTPDRLVIIDGLSVGNEVVYEMMPTGVAQSVHAYSPAEVSHYRAGWVDKRQDFPHPLWPAVKRDGTALISRDTLDAHYEPWGWLVRQGVGVHCGEAGAFNKTPHDIFLKWICDVLDILKFHNIGWALWNFRGSFGVLDSGREDVAYEDFSGHKLDRKLLTLLQYH
jgi:aryl-phospho-beta-D-glucosidase BglC (GH1 family)